MESDTESMTEMNSESDAQSQKIASDSYPSPRVVATEEGVCESCQLHLSEILTQSATLNQPDASWSLEEWCQNVRGIPRRTSEDVVGKIFAAEASVDCHICQRQAIALEKRISSIKNVSGSVKKWVFVWRYTLSRVTKDLLHVAIWEQARGLPVLNVCRFDLFRLTHTTSGAIDMATNEASVKNSSYRQEVESALSALVPLIDKVSLRWTNSPITLNRIRDWVHECAENHPDCELSDPDDQKWRPDRLLLISENGRVVRLVDRGTHDVSKQQYATLSHCWGVSGHRVMLRSDTEHDLRRGIATGVLAKTFQQAIMIAHQLNVRLIWIDSLCILQDAVDGKDWQEQNRYMGKIYHCAAFNIAAHAATNDDQGMVFERNPHIELGFRFLADSTGRQPNPNKEPDTRSQPKDIWALRWTTPRYAVDKTESYLHARGWCFQERYLNRRELMFGQGVVAWRCAKDFQTEQCVNAEKNFFLEGAHGNLHHGLLSRSKLWTYLHKIKRRSVTDAEQFCDADFDDNQSTNAWKAVGSLWVSLVHSYCFTRLTRHSDRLVAFSAVAREFSIVSGRDYVAGLWRDGLIWQLGWQVRRLGHRDYQEYAAPSWSWASIDGPVFPLWDRESTYIQPEYAPHMNYVLRPLAEVRDVRIEYPTGGSKFGQVKSACIYIQGSLIGVNGADVAVKDLEQSLPVYSASGTCYKFYPDPSYPSDQGLSAREHFILPLWSDADASGPPLGSSDEKVFLFVRGLLLERCAENGEAYRRIGIGDFRGRAKSPVDSTASDDEMGLTEENRWRLVEQFIRIEGKKAEICII